MERSRRYEQLQPEERLTLASLMQQKKGVREMARMLGRSAATVSRELQRNGCPSRGYASRPAQALSERRRREARPAPKLSAGWLKFQMLTMLSWRWSPQQMARTLRAMHPDETSKRVSHETIYQALYAHAGGELRRELLSCLRWQRSKRRARSAGEDRRGRLPEMLGIALRDPAVDERIVPGHWEGDFIKGAGNRSAVGVLVERRSRLVLLAKMDDCSAASALAGFAAKLTTIPDELRLSLTYDQGKEMARHAELTARTGMPVYFCDPHSPWQRGTCENTNGLLRQFLPKGTDLSVHTQQDLDYIAGALNGRPRQTLDWNCPLYFFEDLLKHDHAADQAVTT